jgi:hypothetical protein
MVGRSRLQAPRLSGANPVGDRVLFGSETKHAGCRSTTNHVILKVASEIAGRVLKLSSEKNLVSETKHAGCQSTTNHVILKVATEIAGRGLEQSPGRNLVSVRRHASYRSTSNHVIPKVAT